MGAQKIRNSWWVCFRWHKKRYRLRSPDNRREGAIAYERVLRRRLASGEEVYLASDPRSREIPAGEQSFEGFARKWLQQVLAPGSELKPSTRVSYQRHVRLYLIPFFGRYPLKAVTAGLINDFRNARAQTGRRGLSGKTMNNALSVLRRILVEASDAKLIEHVPRMRWCARVPKERGFLMQDEGARLIAATEPSHWRLMVLCGLRTGMRFGELLALRWHDVDFRQNFINVRRNVVDGIEGTPKNNRFRQVPMTDDLRTALLAAPHLGERVHVLPNGDTPSRWSAVGALHRACRRAQLRQIGWHTLRHSFATQLLAAGVDVVSVQALLGHSTIEMTMQYLHVAMPMMRSAIARLGEVGQMTTLSGQPAANFPATERVIEVPAARVLAQDEVLRALTFAQKQQNAP